MPSLSKRDGGREAGARSECWYCHPRPPGRKRPSDTLPGPPPRAAGAPGCGRRVEQPLLPAALYKTALVRDDPLPHHQWVWYDLKVGQKPRPLQDLATALNRSPVRTQSCPICTSRPLPTRTCLLSCGLRLLAFWDGLLFLLPPVVQLCPRCSVGPPCSFFMAAYCSTARTCCGPSHPSLCVWVTAAALWCCEEHG